jgi:hypothetical protein
MHTGANIVVNVALLLFGATLLVGENFATLRTPMLYASVAMIMIYSASFR